VYNIDFSLTNGLGKPAISIYYSGCDIPVKCKDCHNPELWNKSNVNINYKELHRLVSEYKNFNKSAELIVSFMGGDPLAEYNRESTMEVSRRLKEDFPEVVLIVYSWRTPKEIEKEWIEHFDFGVLGQFDIGVLNKGYLPASSNQIIYNFKTNTTLESIKLNQQ